MYSEIIWYGLSYRRLLKSPKDEQKYISSIYREEKVINYFQKCSFGAMSRSIGRLKATAIVVCRI